MIAGLVVTLAVLAAVGVGAWRAWRLMPTHQNPSAYELSQARLRRGAAAHAARHPVVSRVTYSRRGHYPPRQTRPL